MGWAGGVGQRRHIWFCGWPNSLKRFEGSGPPSDLYWNICCIINQRWTHEKLLFNFTSSSGLPAEVVASKLGPVFSDNLLHALLPGRHHGQPHQHRPQAVFLPDVVGTCPNGGQQFILLTFLGLSFFIRSAQ